MPKKPDLIDVSIRLRGAMDDLILRQALADLLHEIDRELRYIEQDQRIFETLKQKKNENL